MDRRGLIVRVAFDPEATSCTAINPGDGNRNPYLRMRCGICSLVKRQIDFPLCTSTIPLVFLVLPLLVCLTLLACIPSSLYFFRFPFVPLVRGFSFFDRLELERVKIR